MTRLRGLVAGVLAFALLQSAALPSQSRLQMPPPDAPTSADEDTTPQAGFSLFSRNSEWEILGPFPSGMREQDFGADPLEPYGGFRSLRFDPHARFTSELADGGTVGWHKTQQDSEDWVNVLFPDIPWQFNEKFLGWGFNQYQAWARTTFRVPELWRILSMDNDTDMDEEELRAMAAAVNNPWVKVPVTVQCLNIGDFYVDDERLSGDWYGYDTTRHTLYLEPGTTHTLSVRVAHEVRIFGGIKYPPPSKFKCYLRFIPLPQDERTGRVLRPRDRERYQVQVVADGIGNRMFMDAVEDTLAGNDISLTLRNVGQDTVYLSVISHFGIRIPGIPRDGDDQADAFRAIYEPSNEDFKIQLRKDKFQSVRIATNGGGGGGEGRVDGYPLPPGVHASIPLTLDWDNFAAQKFVKAMHQYGKRDHDGQLLPTQFLFWFEFHFVAADGYAWKVATYRPTILDWKPWGHWYKYTFLDFDHSVQYAVAIPPQNPSATQKAPMLVALHGAGTEVQDREMWLNAFERRDKTWIVLPTGRSPWGFDWHGPSTMNVERAIQFLADELPGVPKKYHGITGLHPDPKLRFMAGHSNGGQGCWFMTTHFPDKAVASTPAAGYVNIKQYVPYTNWLSNSFTDPALRGVLEASIAEFDNDVYMSNTAGIPILARVGSIDDNVAPFNSRKMVRLGQEHARNQSAVQLSEVAGLNHWFDGIMQGPPMEKFQQQFLHDTIHNVKTLPGAVEPKVAHPPFPSSFVITLLNPASMGTKGGIQVEQLRVPFRKGLVRVHIKHDASGAATWHLQTTNIRRFSFPQDDLQLVARRGRIHRLVIDDVLFDNAYKLIETATPQPQAGTFLRVPGSPKWQFVKDEVTPDGLTVVAWKQVERHRLTYGPAIQVLEKEMFVVVGTQFDGAEWNKAAKHISKIVAHDVYQYSRVTPLIITDREYIEVADQLRECEACSVVLIGDALQNSATAEVLQSHPSPVNVDRKLGKVTIQPSLGLDTEVEIQTDAEFSQSGTGLLMLRPLGSSGLALIIAGLDVKGLEGAARLFPKRTGLLVPDWVITGPEMPWKGAGGILAAGYVQF
ncbi:hypothetical protein DFQ26_002600 [Actinomortierella ambigua]|nr:hypothetical protein DFQ26_002600 [Actinomortierella ambigua]